MKHNQKRNFAFKNGDTISLLPNVLSLYACLNFICADRNTLYLLPPILFSLKSNSLNALPFLNVSNYLYVCIHKRVAKFPTIAGLRLPYLLLAIASVASRGSVFKLSEDFNLTMK